MSKRLCVCLFASEMDLRFHMAHKIALLNGLHNHLPSCALAAAHGPTQICCFLHKMYSLFSIRHYGLMNSK